MANILEKDSSILAVNLNLGRRYLITTVATANIFVRFCGRIGGKKNCFWDFLTFGETVRNTQSGQLRPGFGSLSNSTLNSKV